jgi:hypothetical protein
MYVSAMKCIYEWGRKILLENLRGKSVNYVEKEVRETVCKVLNWIEAIQDKVLWPQ